MLPPAAAARVAEAKSSAITTSGPDPAKYGRGCRYRRAVPASPSHRSRGRPLNTVGDAHDAAVTNADIGPEFVAGRYDGAAADGEVEL